MQSMRDSFATALLSLAREHQDLYVLSADLSSSLKLEEFKQAFPQQYLEVGVSEQNMIGVAAGLAMLGKTVIVTSFASFSPGRNWEQIRTSVCDQNLNVKIVGSHAGLSTGPDGGTHQALEDLALMTVLPNMKVFVPCDYQETSTLTRELVLQSGPAYLRLSRADTRSIDQHQSQYHFGQARVIKKPQDITLVACGLMVDLALQAAKELKQELDLEVGVINYHTLKPFDSATLVDASKHTLVFVTIEEHQKIGGLGSLVASVLSENDPKNIEMVAVNDLFGQSGSQSELFQHYQLTVDHIKDKAIAGLQKRINVSKKK